MCMLCEIAKAGTREEVIGKVSEQLRVDWKASAVKTANVELDIEQEILNARRAYVNGEITEDEADVRQAEIDAWIKSSEEETEQAKKALWDRLYVEFKFTPEECERQYSMDPDTGEVTLYVKAFVESDDKGGGGIAH